MSLIKVDTERCGRDGICIEVCPLNLLSLDPEGWPQMLPAEAAFCIGCGHTVLQPVQMALWTTGKILSHNIRRSRWIILPSLPKVRSFCARAAPSAIDSKAKRMLRRQFQSRRNERAGKAAESAPARRCPHVEEPAGKRASERAGQTRFFPTSGQTPGRKKGVDSMSPATRSARPTAGR